MEIKQDESLAKHSWFKIGGNADYFVKLQSKDDIDEAFSFVTQKQLPFMVIGGGSNVLFSDRGYRGVIIKNELSSVTDLQQGKFGVLCGTTNSQFFRDARNAGYDYSPYLTVPGTIGGAIFGNAGIPGHELKDVLVDVEVFDIELMQFRKLPADYFQMQYRQTLFHTEPQVAQRLFLYAATLQLPPCAPEKIDQRAKEYVNTRKAKQPWGKTGGSFFKNPAEGAAGYYLEQAGFKGARNGGANFSEKHANFMMNDGTATQKQVIELAQAAKSKVFTKYGVELSSEVRILDEHGQLIVI